MAYCDYTFYKDVFLGDAIEADVFPRLAERASEYVFGVTKGLSDQVSGPALEAVKKAVCAVAEVVQDENRMNAGGFSGKGAKTSETVGGHSVSYANPGFSYSQVEYIAARKRDAILLYLGNVPPFQDLFKVRSFSCHYQNRRPIHV